MGWEAHSGTWLTPCSSATLNGNKQVKAQHSGAARPGTAPGPAGKHPVASILILILILVPCRAPVLPSLPAQQPSEAPGGDVTRRGPATLVSITPTSSLLNSCLTLKFNCSLKRTVT